MLPTGPRSAQVMYGFRSAQRSAEEKSQTCFLVTSVRQKSQTLSTAQTVPGRAGVRDSCPGCQPLEAPPGTPACVVMTAVPVLASESGLGVQPLALQSLTPLAKEMQPLLVAGGGWHLHTDLVSLQRPPHSLCSISQIAGPERGSELAPAVRPELCVTKQ